MQNHSQTNGANAQPARRTSQRGTTSTPQVAEYQPRRAPRQQASGYEAASGYQAPQYQPAPQPTTPQYQQAYAPQPQPAPEKSGIAFAPVVGASLAAVTSLLLSSRIGVGGSVLTVAVGAAVTALSSQIYTRLAQASAQKLRQVAKTPGAQQVSGITDSSQLGQTYGFAQPADAVYSADGTRVAPASMREAAAHRHHLDVRKRGIIVTAALALAAVLVAAGIVSFATAGNGIGPKTQALITAADETATDEAAGQPADAAQQAPTATAAPAGASNTDSTTASSTDATADSTGTATGKDATATSAATDNASGDASGEAETAGTTSSASTTSDTGTTSNTADASATTDSADATAETDGAGSGSPAAVPAAAASAASAD